MTLDLGDLPGWITTLIALGGIVYGGYNVRKFALERQREQAEKVYFGMEIDGDQTRIHVMNLSDMPVTHTDLYFRDYPELTWSDRASRPLLMMGEDWELELHYPETVQYAVVGYVSFTDASNRTWYKLSNGKLYSFGAHPGILARLRYFPRDWVIRLRTWRMTPAQKTTWLQQHGFLGGLFRWGFGKVFQ